MFGEQALRTICGEVEQCLERMDSTPNAATTLNSLCDSELRSIVGHADRTILMYEETLSIILQRPGLSETVPIGQFSGGHGKKVVEVSDTDETSDSASPVIVETKSIRVNDNLGNTRRAYTHLIGTRMPSLGEAEGTRRTLMAPNADPLGNEKRKKSHPYRNIDRRMVAKVSPGIRIPKEGRARQDRDVEVLKSASKVRSVVVKLIDKNRHRVSNIGLPK